MSASELVPSCEDCTYQAATAKQRACIRELLELIDRQDAELNALRALVGHSQTEPHVYNDDGQALCDGCGVVMADGPGWCVDCLIPDNNQ